MQKYKGLFITNIIFHIINFFSSTIAIGLIVVQFLTFRQSHSGSESDFFTGLGFSYILTVGFAGFLSFIIFILDIVCGAVLVSKPGFSGTGTLILVGRFFLPFLAFIGVCIGLSKISRSGGNNYNNFYNPNNPNNFNGFNQNQNNFNGFNQNNSNNFNQGL